MSPPDFKLDEVQYNITGILCSVIYISIALMVTFTITVRGVASLQLMGRHSILAPSRHSYNVRFIVI